MLSKTSNKSREDNDCSIIALADHFKISYKTAKNVCEFYGGKAANEPITMKGFVNAAIALYEETASEPIIENTNSLIVENVSEVMKDGFIICSDHVMQIKKGVITNNPREKYNKVTVECIIYC